MKALSLMTLVVFGTSICCGADLPRSSPEAQGVSSPAVLSFIETADKQIDSMHSFMLLRHGCVVAEGWWSPYSAASPHSLYSLSKSFASTAVGLAIAEGKLGLDDKVLKFFPEDAPPEPSDNLKAMRSPRPALHGDGPAKRAAADAGPALDQDLPGGARPVQAGHSFPLQHLGHVHALGDRAESDGHDRAGLSPPAAVRTAGHRAPDMGI